MEQEQRRKGVARDYYESLLIAFIFVNFVRIFVFQAFKIPSGSMYDNLLVGDHIIVNKFVFGANASDGSMWPLRQVHRGDVVIFRYPEEPEIDFIKRVVALPGETVTIRNKEIFVDGELLDEPYKVHLDENIYPVQPALPEPWRSRDQFGPFRVPPGQYFVLGDNRDRSHDSRYWGAVPRDLIKGRALLIYWSFRGVPAAIGSRPAERARELLRVVTGFFPQTRWDRTFMVIGHGYHYDEPETAP